MSSFLAIGDFSRATHLSVKTLRHYHRLGLLVPAEVDPDSSYRRYSTEQIPTAQVIRRFRDVVVSGRVKMVKPDPAIFAEMHRRIEVQLPGIEAHELVFIDDVTRNVAAATALGWNAIHHTSAAQTEAKLRELGLPV